MSLVVGHVRRGEGHMRCFHLCLHNLCWGCRICDQSVLASECYFWMILWVRHLLEDLMGFPGGSTCKESACQCRRRGYDPWVRKICRIRKWQPTPVFLPGESLWTEEFGGLQYIGSQRVRHNLATKQQHRGPDTQPVNAEMITVVGMVMVLGVGSSVRH